MEKENITVELLEEQFGDNVYEAALYVRGKYPPLERFSLSKPLLPNGYSSEIAMEWAIKLKEYEGKKEINEQENTIKRKEREQLEEILKEYIKYVSDFYIIVPVDKQDKVWYLAYSHGIDDGFHNVHSELIDLIELFR